MADYLRAILALHLPRVRKATPDGFWFVGLALIAYGVGMIYAPAGVIVAGLGLCFIGYAMGDDS